ncbi:N-6 DNA methylase, partial [Escherichia coli]|nr:N-6 DNA methylase [Escherichia coli]
EHKLDAVIGLPEKLFFGTGIPAAILVFKHDKEDGSVLFIDASRDFIKGTNQNPLHHEKHVNRIVETYRAREAKTEKYSYLAQFEEMVENDFNLNIPRYVDTFEEEEAIDLMAVRAERELLKKELADLDVQMQGYLKELGYDA